MPGHVDIANRAQAERRPANDLGAYDLMLRAESLLYQDYGSREGMRLMELALEVDPGYARAHAGLACYHTNTIFGYGSAIAEATALARHHAETALGLDPGDPVVHAALAETYLLIAEHDLARHHIDKAISLNPNDFLVMVNAGFIMAYLGDYEAGIEWARLAVRRDPYSADAFRDVYFEIYYLAGQYEEAIQQLIGWQPMPSLMYLELAAAYAQLDRMDEAREAAKRHEETRLEGYDTVEVVRTHARMCAIPEDGARWLEGYRKAGIPV